MPKLVDVVRDLQTALAVPLDPGETKPAIQSNGVMGGLQAAIGGVVVVVSAALGYVVDWGAITALGAAVGGVWSAVQGVRAAWGRVTATTIIRR